jgi:hypothetical protein
MWWVSMTKALAVGFVAYAGGFTAQWANSRQCGIDGDCLESATPNDLQVMVFSALVFAAAFCFFLFRAWRRERLWRP